jgi:hypothetical protein
VPEPQSGALTTSPHPPQKDVGGRKLDVRNPKQFKILLLTSYLRLLFDGVPGGIRTPDPRIRSPMLYPAELQAQ